MLPRKITHDAADGVKRLYRIVRLDTHQELPGEILSADADNGVCVMRERGPDEIAEDGTRTPTYRTNDYTLGPDGLAIIRR